MHAKFEQIDGRFDQVDARFEAIDRRLDRIDERFEQVDERFVQMDRRFEQIDRRFAKIDEQLTDIRKENKNLKDIIRDMDLRTDIRFAELQEGQAELRSSISDLRYQLFHEEGARETVDDSIYQSLDKQLRLVEAKFPDLAKRSAA